MYKIWNKVWLKTHKHMLDNSPLIHRFLVLGFENLVFAIFEFVHALVESPKFRVAVKSGLSDLMYYIVLYMQITHEQVCLISKNSNFYLAHIVRNSI